MWLGFFFFSSSPSFCTDCMWAGFMYSFCTVTTLDDLLNFFFFSISKPCNVWAIEMLARIVYTLDSFQSAFQSFLPFI